MKKLKDFFILKPGDPEHVFAFKLFFWIWMTIYLFIGSMESLTVDKCTISRLAELTPSYLIGCAIFGKRLPDFEF